MALTQKSDIYKKAVWNAQKQDDMSVWSPLEIKSWFYSELIFFMEDLSFVIIQCYFFDSIFWLISVNRVQIFTDGTQLELLWLYVCALCNVLLCTHCVHTVHTLPVPIIVNFSSEEKAITLLFFFFNLCKSAGSSLTPLSSPDPILHHSSLLGVHNIQST